MLRAFSEMKPAKRVFSAIGVPKMPPIKGRKRKTAFRNWYIDINSSYDQS